MQYDTLETSFDWQVDYSYKFILILNHTSWWSDTSHTPIEIFSALPLTQNCGF